MKVHLGKTTERKIKRIFSSLYMKQIGGNMNLRQSWHLSSVAISGLEKFMLTPNTY